MKERVALAFMLGLGAGFWGGTYVAVRAGAWITPEPVVVERWIFPPRADSVPVPNTPLTPEEERRLAEVLVTTTTLLTQP